MGAKGGVGLLTRAVVKKAVSTDCVFAVVEQVQGVGVGVLTTGADKVIKCC